MTKKKGYSNLALSFVRDGKKRIAKFAFLALSLTALITYLDYFKSSSSLIELSVGKNKENVKRLLDSTLSSTFSTQYESGDGKMDRLPKLGDGCYHVFLDLGANIGVHGRFLFEPLQYPYIRNETKKIFEDYFEPAEQRDPRNICIFAFEPNPVHKERHIALQAAYGEVGLRYHPIPAGVSDLEGNLTFYHQDNGLNNEWGFRAFEGRPGGENIPVNVPVIRLKTWLHDNILDRLIPEHINSLKQEDKSSNINNIPPPKVVMKMDIEGAEYIVLPDLMMSGILCQTVDYIFGEFHGHNMNIEPNPDTGSGGGFVNGNGLKFSLLYIINSLRNDDCRFKKLDNIDDESYHMDGIPLPPSNAWW